MSAEERKMFLARILKLSDLNTKILKLPPDGPAHVLAQMNANLLIELSYLQDRISRLEREAGLY